MNPQILQQLMLLAQQYSRNQAPRVGQQPDQFAQQAPTQTLPGQFQSAVAPPAPPPTDQPFYGRPEDRAQYFANMGQGAQPVQANMQSGVRPPTGNEKYMEGGQQAAPWAPANFPGPMPQFGGAMRQRQRGGFQSQPFQQTSQQPQTFQPTQQPQVQQPFGSRVRQMQPALY